MTPRCDASSSTRGNQSSTPGSWLAGGPCRIGSGRDERKATGNRLLLGLHLGAQVLFWQGVVPDFSHIHHSFSTKTCPTAHPTASSRNKRQGHQVQGSCGLRLGMLPTPLGEILHPKTRLFIPLQRGEPQRERCRIIWDSSTHTVTLHRGRHFSKEWV